LQRLRLIPVNRVSLQHKRGEDEEVPEVAPTPQLPTEVSETREIVAPTRTDADINHFKLPKTHEKKSTAYPNKKFAIEFGDVHKLDDFDA